MPIYVVNVQQVYQQPMLVRAENEQEAIHKVDGGDGERLDHDLQYSYTLEPDSWTAQVYEEKDEQD